MYATADPLYERELDAWVKRVSDAGDAQSHQRIHVGGSNVDYCSRCGYSCEVLGLGEHVRPAIPRGAEPATPAQIAYLTRLLGERQVPPALADQVANATKRQASALIDQLRECPFRPRSTAPVGLPAVPGVAAGKYALVEDGEVRFYEVEIGTKGRWIGFTFLSAQASDELHPIRSKERKAAVLTAIAADPQAAADRYWVELGRCRRCHRTLTSEWRHEGIGPECVNLV
jgi:hypothetical protein